MRNLLRAVMSATVAVSVVLTAACGSHTATGPVEPTEPAIDLSKLDTGNMATKPKAYGTAVNLDQAKALEAERLANYLPLPADIDPALQYPAAPATADIRTFVNFGSGAMAGRMDADPNAMNDAAKGFLSAFVTAGRSEKEEDLSYYLENVVLLFTDDTSAADAAQALGRTEMAANSDDEQITVDGYPKAFAYVTNDEHSYQRGCLFSWYATGRFVIYTRVIDSVMNTLKTRDLPKLVGHLQRSLEVIPPALAKFPATPQDKLMELAIDPDRVIARALHTILDDPGQAGIPGVYDLHGGLQLVQGPDSAKLLGDAGVDRVAWKGNFLYRARDAAGAALIVADHSETSHTFIHADSPPNLPNAVCRKYIGPSFAAIPYYCFVWHDRYAAEVSAGQLQDAQQRISAQYAMLVNPF
ncbi:hypothetical protein ACFXHA_06530 [Nocardia sp. NPDC059240]|uniref:DUF7373 family lipoprotein n=1 Tax=Nocardia sp. NPDC059240 TaxID=3346786 RepID=UPI00368D19D5